jgi:hypothetical protein
VKNLSKGIKQSENSWINMSEKAVFIKINPKDIKPSKQEYQGEIQHVFVVGKEVLIESLGKDKAVKLGLFEE